MKKIICILVAVILFTGLIWYDQLFQWFDKFEEIDININVNNDYLSQIKKYCNNNASIESLFITFDNSVSEIKKEIYSCNTKNLYLRFQQRDIVMNHLKVWMQINYENLKIEFLDYNIDKSMQINQILDILWLIKNKNIVDFWNTFYFDIPIISQWDSKYLYEICNPNFWKTNSIKEIINLPCQAWVDVNDFNKNYFYYW